MFRVPDLKAEELVRYARHLTLPEVGAEGQAKLHRARVLLVGAGGLGSPAGLYLAAAGVGTLGVIDHDVVEASNLQRQILHDTAGIGRGKAESAKARLEALNPFVQVEAIAHRLTSANAREIIRRFDIVVDGSDNFPTRYLVNDACVLEHTPLVYGSIFRFEGQLSLFSTPGGPCYRCLFAEPPAPELIPSCEEAGVLGVLPGIIGTLQALEVLKWILGIGDSTAGRLVLVDALRLRVREIAVERDPACAICGDRPILTTLQDYDAFCGVGVRACKTSGVEITAGALAATLSGGAAPFLLDVREPWEFAIAHLPDAVLLPLSELPARLMALPRDRDVVTICHHGLRSLTARTVLVDAGFSRVRSLAGGVDGWAAEVDPAMPRY